MGGKESKKKDKKKVEVKEPSVSKANDAPPVSKANAGPPDSKANAAPSYSKANDVLPSPGITSSAPLPNSEQPAATGSLRSASNPTITPLHGEPPPVIYEPSTPDRGRSRMNSPRSSLATGSGARVGSFSSKEQHHLKKSRRNRTSGIFSHDTISADISVGPSSPLIARPPPDPKARKTRTSGDIKFHSFSIAGSSSLEIAPTLSGGPAGDLDITNPTHPHNTYRPFRRKWRRFRRKYKGCIFALLSSITSSIASYFVHRLTHKTSKMYDATYCLLWRYFGVLFPGIFIVLFYRCIQKERVFDSVWPDKKNYKKFLLSCARAVVDVAAVLLNYLAFSYLLQSETSTILNSKPIIVQLLAHFTLGEPWGIVPIIVSVFAAVGVMVISKPPFFEGKGFDADFTERLKGIGLSVASMLLASVVYVILRYLKDVHYSVFSLFIGTVGLSFALVVTLIQKTLVLPHIEDLPYFLTLAAFVCVSSISIVIALQNEEAFVVSLVRSCDVIFSFIWEMSLDGKYPNWYSGGGAAIVMFCVVIIFFRKYLTHQEPEKRIYKIFRFLTK